MIAKLFTDTNYVTATKQNQGTIQYGTFFFIEVLLMKKRAIQYALTGHID
jgi:hypothetical protein